MKQSEHSMVRLTVNAIYRDGSTLCSDQELLVHCFLEQSTSPAFRMVRLALVVPTRQSGELMAALRKGEVELLIQDIPPLLET